MTTSQWIQRAISVHGKIYDYSKVEYTNSRNKVVIRCKKHGYFEQEANSHLQGHGCRECFNSKRGKSRQLTTHDFVVRAKEVHGDKYDYSKTEYAKSSVKVNIICRIHGVFSQHPHHHLRGHGCTYCGNNTLKSQQEFIKQCVDIHGDKYDYSLVSYRKNKIKVKIICKKHGVFEQYPINHLNQKQGCPECAGVLPINTKDFVERATEVHNGKYSYDKVSCESGQQRVVIICPNHGEFTQQVSSHLKGFGCNRCVVRGYNRSRFTDISDVATLYIMKLYNNLERFYKIGITTKSVRERINNPKLPYECELIASLKIDSRRAFDFEKKMHRRFIKNNYIPSLSFHGKTECFLLNKTEVYEAIKELNNMVNLICLNE